MTNEGLWSGGAAVTVAELMARSGVPFGTSGVRGLADAMSDDLCHAYACAFLDYLRQIGEFADGGRVALAGDLRESTPRILAACAQAVRTCGGEVVFCGHVPTPALAFHAMNAAGDARGAMPSIMVTGSHIPADRNGIKFYRPHGEVLKTDEPGILAQAVRPAPAAYPAALGAPVDVETGYVARYVRHFGADALSGLKVGVYQHSAVGRDLMVRVVEAMGGRALPFGRSEQFLPVDTEAIRAEDVALAAEWARANAVDAIISTDGDSDRPLVADAQGAWLRGDVLGLICAQAVGADVVVTPVSSNSVLELSGAVRKVVRTRIGSPYVIAAMIEAAAAEPGLRICGYEANGGFLLGSRAGNLDPLPTRDAVLPILAALIAARDRPLADVVAALPPRFTFSDRLPDFAPPHSAALMNLLGRGTEAEQFARLDRLFGGVAGLPVAIDRTDGYRIGFASGAVIHLRASGNAPELRCYTEAASAAAAQDLNARALAEVTAKILPEALAVEAGTVSTG